MPDLKHRHPDLAAFSVHPSMGKPLSARTFMGVATIWKGATIIASLDVGPVTKTTLHRRAMKTAVEWLRAGGGARDG